MEVLKKIKKYSFILGFIFIFYIFRYITTRTPLAGDDWGYCLVGSEGDILRNTINFYYSWSGRFFCELWGFTMATYREIWDFVNPLLFSLIFLCIYFIGQVNKKEISSFLLIIAMMLSVFFQIRTQTYTWIAGGNYSVSLCLSLLYFLLLDILINKNLSKKYQIIINVLSNLLLLIIGLMIENISLTMIIGLIIVIIYLYKKNKREIIKYLIINLIISIIGFCITRLSPGSAFRLARDHADWVNLSFFEKISSGYKYFLEYGFINNSYTISIFSLIMVSLVWFSKNGSKLHTKIISSFILLVGVFVVFSQKVIGPNNFLIDSNAAFSMLFWPLYIVNAFYVLFCYMPNGLNKEKSIFFLLIGGISASAMIMSPVNGARAYVYLVYYVILVSVIVFNSFEINKYFAAVIAFAFLFVINNKTNYYKIIYDEIEYAQEQRLVEIKYYQEHPEDEEVWIKRFPENALHSIDIEEGDTYHFDVFKKYYDLPQSADNIMFYFDKK